MNPPAAKEHQLASVLKLFAEILGGDAHKLAPSTVDLASLGQPCNLGPISRIEEHSTSIPSSGEKLWDAETTTMAEF